jgi:hypothetical protein
MHRARPALALSRERLGTRPLERTARHSPSRGSGSALALSRDRLGTRPLERTARHSPTRENGSAPALSREWLGTRPPEGVARHSRPRFLWKKIRTSQSAKSEGLSTV